MSLEIKQGLFKLDLNDQHAILGVPIDADFKEIRKRYLKIAQRLHPDTCPFEDEKEKEFANQLWSKLVNPAYNKFSKESERTEYGLLLKTMSKRIAKDINSIQLQTEGAKKLLQAPDCAAAYTEALNQLAKDQFTTLDQVLDKIGQLSELNLAYLMRQSQGGVKAAPAPAPAPAPPPPPPKKDNDWKKDSVVEQGCHRAEEFMKMGNYGRALLELKDVIKKEPNNARCHGLVGMCYLRQNQATMAKVHITKALQLDPKEPTALEAKKGMNPAAVAAAAKAADAKAAKTPPKTSKKPDPKSDQKGGGGLFGGLFGGGKKK